MSDSETSSEAESMDTGACPSSPAEPTTAIATGPTMTWLDAAELVLREASPTNGMHITPLTQIILDRRLVQSSSRTSLETLLYRETLQFSKRFKRIPGKLGWFGLLSEEERMQAILQEQNAGKQVTVSRKRQRTVDESEDDDELQDIERQKYRLLRRAVKEIIFENSALAEEVQRLDDKLAHSKAERRYLLKRLLMYENNEVQPPIVASAVEAVQRRQRRQNGRNPILMPNLAAMHNAQRTPMSVGSMARSVAVIPNATPTPPVTFHDRISPRVGGRPAKSAMPAKGQKGRKDHPPTTTGRKGGKGAAAMVSYNQPSMVGRSHPPLLTGKSKAASASKKKKAALDTSVFSSGKSKRKKPGMVRRRIQPIPIDAKGLPIFPIALGGLTVLSLGTIVTDRATFHSERYIWPVGFRSTRTYPSMTDRDKRCLYTCMIRDGGESPLFEMVADDDPDNVITAPSATACLCIVLTAVNKAREREATNTGSGPEFFGFSHPTIQNLIQHLPGAERCSKYQWMDYDAPRVVKGSASHSFGSGVPGSATPASAGPKRAAAPAAAKRGGRGGRAAHSSQHQRVAAWQGRGVYQQPVVSNTGPYYPSPAAAAASQSESSSGSYSSSSESGSESESEEEPSIGMPHPSAMMQHPPAAMQHHLQHQAMWGGGRPGGYIAQPGMVRGPYIGVPPGLARHPMTYMGPHAQLPVHSGSGMVHMPQDQYGSSESGSGSESGSESGSSGSESESDYEDDS